MVEKQLYNEKRDKDGNLISRTKASPIVSVETVYMKDGKSYLSHINERDALVDEQIAEMRSDEEERSSAEEGRESAESERTKAFNESQDSRQTEFNESLHGQETKYEQAESARNTLYQSAEQQRNATFENKEAERDAAVEEATKVSEGFGHNGLDFSQYTGANKARYNKAIIFAGVVAKEGYEDITFVINGLRGYINTTNGRQVVDIWLKSKDDEGNNHLIKSTGFIEANTGDIVYCKTESDAGIFYWIVNLKAFDITKEDGDKIIWADVGTKEVIVSKILPTDPRIEHFGKKYATTTDLSSLNSSLTEKINNVNDTFKTTVENNQFLDFSRSTANYEQRMRYCKALPFALVVPNAGYEDAPFMIGVLSNKFSAGNCCLYVADSREWTEDNRKVYNEIIYRVAYPTTKYVFANVSNSYGTLYAIIDFEYINNECNDSIVQSYGGGDTKVRVNKTTADDPRLKMFAEFATTQYVDNAVASIVSDNSIIDFSNTTYTKDVIEKWNETLKYIGIKVKDDTLKNHVFEIYAFANQSEIRGATQFKLWLYDATASKNYQKICNKVVSEISNQKDFYYIGKQDDIEVYIYADVTKNVGNSFIWGGTAGKRPIAKVISAEDPYIKAWSFDTSNLVEEAPKNGNSYVRNNGQWVINQADNSTFWTNKNIVWFGTSIPAGSDPNLGQEGIGTTYPTIAASLLGATGYNESRGSSYASSVYGKTKQTYDKHKLGMGYTIAEKLAIFKDFYLVDDDAQTVTMGPNTSQSTGLKYTTPPTYAQAVSERKEFLKCSFEAKLISKYLDPTGNFIRNVLNSDEVKASVTYSGNIYNLLFSESDMKFVCQPDLFVFDHGTNDNSIINSDGASVNSTDRTTWYGAMNTFLEWIRFYCPQKMIAQVSVYGTGRASNEYVVYDHQKAFAEYQQIPFLDLTKVLPYGNKTITVQGYWDGNNTQGGVWHDTGFVFEPHDDGTFTTNNDLFIYKWGGAPDSASTIISRYNIRTLHGVQVWDIPQRQVFFKDALHPHTNTTGDALKQTAKVLSKMIEQIPPLN